MLTTLTGNPLWPAKTLHRLRRLATSPRLIITVWAVCISALLYTASPARAEFMVSPLREVMTADQRRTEFTVSNSSQRLLQAKVSLIDLRATPNGYRPATIEDQKNTSAAPWLTVHPVAFTLEPGSRQTIVVTIRDDMPLPDLEKRTHLFIETNAARNAIRKISDTGLGLDMQMGMSVPVIIRPSPAHITSPTSVLPSKFINTALTRDEDNILRIETSIGWHDPDQDKGQAPPAPPVSLYGSVCLIRAHADQCIDNIALYPETPVRHFSLALGDKALDDQAIVLEYRGRAEFEGKVLARKRFSINK